MGIICFDKVTKKYEETTILSELSFSIEEGELVAIIGPSGKGKSTILNMIGLIVEKTSGHFSIDGHSDVSINSKEAMLLRRDRIGYLFQNYGLIDDETVYQNLQLALEYKKLKRNEKKKRIEKILEEFNLSKLKDSKIYQLSGGEQQRVALMRLSLQDSAIILADEPTGSLDTKNRDFVMDYLKYLNSQGKTVIIVTHDMEVARMCKRIINIG